ncbi:hypothetical protein AXG93_1264s1000 [Marchantia polymorpha subsp. ruderalis]|uniref:Uncharacterized protein n=1 Tax=Marchantia polymorpha subsp. ruderalis TaxID=1480154 RepID=A0A176WN76_MARPO|nr:hypothetical protein AXG93_1264s1000 [Marchantia polymorpha subsp. ruderalis]
MGWGSGSEREVATAPVRSRANHKPSSRPKQKACKLVLPASSADTRRAAETRNSPSSGEDASAGVLGRSADLPTRKAHTPWEEARRPSGQGRRHAAPASMPTTEKCLASEQVPLDDSTSSQEPSAQTQLEKPAEDEGKKEETREPSAQTPSAVAIWGGEACPPGARSPIPLEMLAERGVAVAAEEAARPSSRELLRISEATKILDTEDDTGSEDEEVESVRGSNESRADSPGPEVPAAGGEVQLPTRTLCPLAKAAETALQLRDDAAANTQRNFEEQRAKIEAELNSERAQNCILAVELVRQTRLLEQSELARKADEELLRRLQSQCDELRAQRAESELQEIAARERVTLREMEIRAAALMSGDSRSRRRVAKRLDSFLSRLQDAIANLEAEVTAVLRRLGLRSRADDWTDRELVRSRPSHRRHSR